MTNAEYEKLIGGRKFQAYQLREQGLTYTEIGKRMGITAGRVKQLYSIAKHRLEWSNYFFGLSIKLGHLLNNIGIHNREQALEAFNSGKLKPGKGGIRNYGWKSHKEMAKWLGLPEPMKPMAALLAMQTCPHCGKKLKQEISNNPKTSE